MVILTFPYFFVGTFIEAASRSALESAEHGFPYFFVGTFIEASEPPHLRFRGFKISLLFRRDFH